MPFKQNYSLFFLYSFQNMVSFLEHQVADESQPIPATLNTLYTCPFPLENDVWNQSVHLVSYLWAHEEK